MDFWMPFLAALLAGSGILYPFWARPLWHDAPASRLLKNAASVAFILPGLATTLIWIQRPLLEIQWAALVWTLATLAVVLYNRAVSPSWTLLWIPSLFGIRVFIRLTTIQLPVYPRWLFFLYWLLVGSLTVQLILMGLNTGEECSPGLATRTRYWLLTLLGLRWLWDGTVLILFTTEDDYGLSLSLYRFLVQNELRMILVYALTGWFIPVTLALVRVVFGSRWKGRSRTVLDSALAVSVCISLGLSAYFLLTYGYVL